LEFDHKLPGKNIEQRTLLNGFKSTISRRICVAGVQDPSQFAIFLDNNGRTSFDGGVI
jgi:hypothetical protein